MEEPLNLLMVDDSEDDVFLAREALARAPRLRVIHVARDGLEALQYLRREPPFEKAARPHLVVMDINMPRLNGLDALEAIKADPDLRPLPVIMLTVSNRDEDILQAYQRGACTYVRKPLDFGEFVTAMQRLEVYWGRVATLPRG
jgi:CheY-like chemotaxis protein